MLYTFMLYSLHIAFPHLCDCATHPTCYHYLRNMIWSKTMWTLKLRWCIITKPILCWVESLMWSEVVKLKTCKSHVDLVFLQMFQCIVLSHKMHALILFMVQTCKLQFWVWNFLNYDDRNREFGSIQPAVSITLQL